MRPEILAPAGDQASLAAALAAGADAVYFGLDEGLNARARAHNFPLAELRDTVDRIHRAGARAYLTLNTLIFEDEIPIAETLIRGAAQAGVDALIVQDLAIVRLARTVAPALEVHASTQMTVSSPEAARFAAELGVARIVVPRELSVEEITRFAQASPVPLEVFVHGALCMSWSGQCLTSEAWGGRSANRGQCAQSCRLPYQLIVDGQPSDTGDVRYLLSPLDLAAVDHIGALRDAGVVSFKIEGRLKGPDYVTTAVRAYRQSLDGESADLTATALAYSRGFSDGFLGGTDHQALVEGRFPKHRGALLGRVAEVDRGARAVRVVHDARPYARPLSVRPTSGMGIGFDTGAPETHEPGGPLFAVEATRDGWWLQFGDPGPTLKRVRPGHLVWLTSDRARRDRFEGRPDQNAAPPTGRIAVTLRVRGAPGQPLEATVSTARARATGRTEALLAPADGPGLDEARLRSKLGAFGGTPFRLERLDVDMPPGLFIKPSELKALRRRLAAELEPAHLAAYRHVVADAPAWPQLVADAPVAEHRGATAGGDPTKTAVDGAHDVTLIPLCRTDAQLDAVIAAELPYVELDWMERVGLGRAVARARAAGLRIGIATTRVQKPGENGIDAHTERLRPDAVLVRHWGGLEYFRSLPDDRKPEVHGDFSLNVTNAITAYHLLGHGCDSITAAHDLDETQLHALLRRAPAEKVAVTVHHHIPTFHTEHCVYAHQLSDGRDYRTCGRPCEAHRVALRDPNGLEHPVVVDVECRNTVFDARAQSAAKVVPGLVARGVRRLRIEFVWETGEEATAVLAAWSDFIHGKIDPAVLNQRIAAHEQFGVTAGTMRTLLPIIA